MTQYFPGFTRHRVEVGDGITINAVSGGAGPPVLLLHGDPQSHLCWRKVAPALAAHFSVVAADLRGYGRSSTPVGGGDHGAYSKRVMAADQVALMRRLGHGTFAVVGHDRGGRVTHRMLLDHAEILTAAAVIDIVPTSTMFSLLADSTAAAYFWWYLNIQPAPMPETMIAADIASYFRAHIGLAANPHTFEPGILDAYLADYRRPEHIHAVCEDYRAAFTIDRDQHDADTAAGRRITTPFAVIWGRDGAIDRLDPRGIWSAHADTVTGFALPGGHFLAEESPRELSDTLTAFLFTAQTDGRRHTPMNRPVGQFDTHSSHHDSPLDPSSTSPPRHRKEKTEMTTAVTHEAAFTGVRITLDSAKTYEELLAALLEEVGVTPDDLSTAYLGDSLDWDTYARHIAERVGPCGFMLFALLDHTGWINKAGIGGKMMRVVFGNPLIAITVLRHDLKAGLFAPVEFLLSEEDTGSSITYVRPSSLIVVKPHPELLAAAQGLDDKLAALATKVAAV